MIIFAGITGREVCRLHHRDISALLADYWQIGCSKKMVYCSKKGLVTAKK